MSLDVFLITILCSIDQNYGGYSYNLASTNTGSVQLNLRKFPKNSANYTVECTDKSVNNSYKLTFVCDKKASVQVGGGEL